MIGAIAGDIIGSVYEHDQITTTDFELFSAYSTFTDDTVLTVAVADCILHGKEYADALKEYGLRYPCAGYGAMFRKWLGSSASKPYYSYGNGSAMRVSPVGFAFNTLEEVLAEAKRSAEVTHNHPEGIKGAQSVAAAIFLARTGHDKAAIRQFIEDHFEYHLHRKIEDIRYGYSFDVTCQGSVPQAITAFLESTDYEDAVRKAVSLGGDSDTQACIAGGIAQSYYKGVPSNIVEKVRRILDEDLLTLVDEFGKRYAL